MGETLELQGLIFEIRRSARRQTLSLTVDRGGDLVLHTPFTVDNDLLSTTMR